MRSRACGRKSAQCPEQGGRGMSLHDKSGVGQAFCDRTGDQKNISSLADERTGGEFAESQMQTDPSIVPAAE